MQRKGLVFILDGLGDRPCPQLNGKTPLEAAATPTMDHLALHNQCGMMDPLRPGLAADTHTGVGMLFGLPPKDALRLRRGPIEAAGINLELRRGDILLRANFATVEKQARGYRIMDRRAGRISDEAAPLCAALQDVPVAPGITASLHAATQHRAVLRLRGEADGEPLSAQISDTDPGGHAMQRGILQAAPSPSASPDAAAARTAQALNCFTQRAHAILQKHPVNARRLAQGKPPANGIIARSAGRHQPLPNLLTDIGLKVAAVAGEMTILGLAKLFDFACYHSPLFTSLPDTDLAEKLRLGEQALATHDLVFVHIKGTDTAAHDKNPALKAEFIARFDRELGNLNLKSHIIGVCADHSTDSLRGEHNGDPVPVLLANPGGRRDLVKRYNETDCIAGALSRITAQDFLTVLLDAMGALALSNYAPMEMEG